MMSPEMFQVFAVVMVVWGAAVAIKAANALRTGGDYVFSMWDGGLVRVGKRLNKMGKQIKVVVGSVISVGSIALLARAVPYMTALYAIMFFAIVGLVVDFASTEKD